MSFDVLFTPEANDDLARLFDFLLARIFHQGRARVGCDAVRCQGATTLRARAREAETGHKQSLRTVCACRRPKPPALAVQRGQRAAAQLNRVRSARTKLDLVLEAGEASIHAVLRGIRKRPGEISGLDRAETLEDLELANTAIEAIRSALVNQLAASPYSFRKAGQRSTRRELIIPFGATGYVALYEIANPSTLVVLAVRHQREEDYY